MLLEITAIHRRNCREVKDSRPDWSTRITCERIHMHAISIRTDG